jgi:hypothetical protein
MATYVGGSHEVSSSFYHRPPTTTTSTASSVSANMGPTPTFSKALEGLEGVLVRIFTTIKGMQDAIDSCRKKSKAGKASEYLIFRPVTTNGLLEIERGRERGEIDRGVRLTHYVDWNLLIVKVPTVQHEAAHGIFKDELISEAVLIGLRSELISIGATTFKTPRVSKEGDSALKPESTRSGGGAEWPTIVIKSGWSEPLTQLRQDAHIWLEESKGDVKIVLLISISRTARTMIIEKWENRPVPANRPATRSTTRTIPTQIQAITIDSDANTVNAPLTLEFEKIFLRPAVPPLEHDFTFTTQDLLRFAARFWRNVQ